MIYSVSAGRRLLSFIGVVLLSLLLFHSPVIAEKQERSQDTVDEEFKTEWAAFVQAFGVLNFIKGSDVKEKDTFYGGIRGMLATLDPHTHFLDKQTFDFMREEQEGSFYGIGISFDISPDGYLRVVAPIEGTPAFKLGIRAGDKIVKINGKSTKGITEAEVINKLRGKKGTSVVVTVEREGLTELRDFTIYRDKIPLQTVRPPFMIRPGIGYVKVTQFSRPTSGELIDAFEQLKLQKIEKLILDLRNNPGGLLDQAVEVADLFIPKGEKIVSTSGRVESSHFEFYARKDEFFPNMPLVVLVNGGSASASEIVSGAIQDLDRGLIVGTRTFGKGLVQRQYPLPGETAIQITTAKYYTPSGRCIQRPYDTPHERYFRKLKGKASPENAVFHSAKGRIVKGGGGITPDVEVSQKIAKVVITLASHGVFFDFAIHFSSSHQKVPKNFQVSDALFQEFVEYTLKQKLDIKEKALRKNKEELKIWILQEIISAYYGLDEKMKVAIRHDEQVNKAITLFDEAESLLKREKKSSEPTEKAVPDETDTNSI